MSRVLGPPASDAAGRTGGNQELESGSEPVESRHVVSAEGHMTELPAGARGLLALAEDADPHGRDGATGGNGAMRGSGESSTARV